jgi:hypothetical protein
MSAGDPRTGTMTYHDHRAVPTSLSKVEAAQSALDDGMAALCTALDELDRRLQPILTSPPAPTKEAGQVKSVPSTVSEKIAESAGNLHAARDRLVALMDRLEV